MSAMRGASGLPGSGFTGRAKASAGRMPSAAIFGIAPCVVISTNFWSRGALSAGPAALPDPGAGIATSWRAPVLPSMMVTVLVAPAALARRRRFRRWGVIAPRHLRTGNRSAAPAVASALFAADAACRSIGTATIGSPPNWIVADHRPHHEDAEEQRQHPGDELRTGREIGSPSRRFFGRCWPSGALRSSAVMSQFRQLLAISYAVPRSVFGPLPAHNSWRAKPAQIMRRTLSRRPRPTSKSGRQSAAL